MLTKRCYIPHASRQLTQESTTKEVKTVILQQLCSSRGSRATYGPRSNFHMKENLILKSLQIIFIEIINSCGPRRVSERQMWPTSQKVWTPLPYSNASRCGFINKQTRLTMEHAWAVAAETKASSGSFAMLEATTCRCCVRINSRCTSRSVTVRKVWL